MKSLFLCFVLNAVLLQEVLSSSEYIRPNEKWTRGINERVAGGHNATRGQFPFMVYLQNGCCYCGATLLSEQWVLSAGHCTRASTFKVVLGALNPFKDVLEQGGLIITGSEIHVHPQYDVPFKPNNDLVLLKLPQPVNFTDTIQPVSLPPRNASSYAGDAAVVAGWGLTENGKIGAYLQWTDRKVINNSECSQYYKMPVTAVCAVGPSSSGGCSGDSGAPLLVNDGGKYVQIGLYSWYDGKCPPVKPQGYMRISPHVDWISYVTGIAVE